jgi:hypothetical protein
LSGGGVVSGLQCRLRLDKSKLTGLSRHGAIQDVVVTSVW